jgi:hypothetical protein
LPEPVEPDLETAAQTDRAFPWPPGVGGNAVNQFIRTWQESVFRPAAFYAALPKRADLFPPLLYYLIIGVIAAAIRVFWRLSLASMFVDSDALWLRALRMGDTSSPLVDFLLTPLVLLISIALAALISHFALWIVGGARQGLATTTSVLAYANGPALFSVVPLVGSIIGAFWSLVLLVIGLREAHGITTTRALVAVALPVLALLGLFMLLLIALLATGGAALLRPDLPG